MSLRAYASIADEIRALGWLVPADSATRARVLKMLHGEAPCDAAESTAPAPALRPPVPPPIDPSRVLPTAPALPSPQVAPSRAAPPPPAPPPADALRASLADVTQVRQLGQVAAVAVPTAAGLATPTAASEAPASAPILLAPHARAVLKLLAATLGEVNAIDLPRLVARVASGQPIAAIPRRRALTVRRGVQLLLDWGDAMAPLATDREQVRRGLVHLLGADRVQTLGFAGCPTRKSGEGLRGAWELGWQAPAPGVPIVVVSDMGLAGIGFGEDWASPAEWGRFAELACVNGNSVVVLSPFGADRWPESLAHAFTWVPWAEALSAAQLNRIRRDTLIRRR